MLTFYSSLFELIDEALVIFEEQTQVVNTIFQHSNTLYAEAKRKAGHLVRIIAAHTQYIGMYNASA